MMRWRDRLLASLTEREPSVTGDTGAVPSGRQGDGAGSASVVSRSVSDCACRTYARCLPCMERDGLTRRLD